MTIESLAESFREAKAKAGYPARIKYPKKLKDIAIEYFKANPKLTPSRMASKIGISTSCADKWFKSVKQAKAKDRIKTDPPNFVEGHPVFHRIRGIHEHEVARVVVGVTRRVVKYLRMSRKLSPQGEEVCILLTSCSLHLNLSKSWQRSLLLPIGIKSTIMVAFHPIVNSGR